MSDASRSTLDALRAQLEQLSPERRALVERHLAARAAPATTIPRRRESGPAPLTFNQELLWGLDQAVPDLVAYNVPRVLRVRGALDVAALERALAALAARHETLRTRFSASAEGPRQSAAMPERVPLEQRDLRRFPTLERVPLAERIVADAARFRFDLTRDLLLRALVLQLADDEWIVLLLTHHIVSDEWSRDVMFRDLSTLYAAELRGIDAALPPLPVQYADYAAWQRSGLHDGVLGQQLAYWRAQLDGAPTLELPTDRPRTGRPAFHGRRFRFTLPVHTRDAVRTLAREHDATVFMVLLAAFNALVYRYTGQDDFVVASPSSSRRFVELEGLIGFFPNTVLLRSTVAEGATFADLIRSTRETALAAVEHNDVPLESLALALSAGRSEKLGPLCPVSFQTFSGEPVALALDGAEVSTEPIDFGTAKFEIVFGVRESPDGLQGTVEYRTDLFDASTIERFAAHYGVLLDAAAADPAAQLVTLPLLTREERALLVEQWPRGEDVPLGDVTFAAIFARAAQASPDAIAVVDPTSTLTYAALAARVSERAEQLRARGIRPGAVVGVCMTRSVDLMVALLAVLDAGAAYVPIDPTAPTARIAGMLADAGASLVITQSALRDRLETELPVVVLDGAAVAWPIHGDGGPPAAPVQLRPATAADPAYIIFTSGSTGRPKGAVISNGGLVNYVSWAAREYRADEGIGAPVHSSIAFDLTVTSLFVPLAAGRTVFMIPDADGVEGLVRAMRAQRDFSFVKITPAHLDVLRSAMLPTEVAGRTRLFVIGGEQLIGETLAWWQENAPGTCYVNEYGPTETVVGCCVEWVGAEARSGPVAIGRPIQNTQLYVLDAARAPVPIGVAGELYIGGAGVAIEYRGRPDLTRDSFVASPFDPGQRLYRTGDRVRWLADGRLEFLGRVDFQVKVRGYRVELGEIEATLEQHPEVAHAAVQAVPDADGGKTLVAFVVASEASDPDDQESTETVERWSAVFDEMYAVDAEGLPLHATESADPALNVTGWDSSYTRRAIPADEMIEWTERTCDRIRALHPRRVLEIGCGTGLLLLRLAPRSESYTGIDFSAAALASVRRALAAHPLPQVTLQQGRADEVAALATGTYDVVIINSVLQYFPNAEYLVRVLEDAVRLVTPGGSIFLGDVRDRRLLEAFATSVALHQAESDATVGDVIDRARESMRQETELILDPAFFYAVKKHLPAITSVTISPKLDRTSTEMARFRFDVVLRVGGSAPAAAEPVAHDCDEAARLLDSGVDAVRIIDLVDERIASDVRAAELARGMSRAASARELARASAHSGVAPADVCDRFAGYDVVPTLAASGTLGRFDIVVRQGEARSVPPFAPELAGAFAIWSDFSHRQADGVFAPRVIARWREYLAGRLPAHMIPAVYVRLDEWPLTRNGKLDRTALKPPSTASRARAFVAPRTEHERLIAGIWAEVLRLDRVGLDEGFLDLGGHSLLAMRIIGRIRRELGVAIPLDALLRGQTVAELAAVVQAAATSAASEPEAVIAPIDRGAFVRHAATGAAT